MKIVTTFDDHAQAEERVRSFLGNLGRRMSMDGAGSKLRTGPEGTLLFPFFTSCGG